LKNIKQEWNDIIAQKLKAGQTIEDLKHSYPDGIVMEPNVTYDDVKEIQHKVITAKPWINMAAISGQDATEKNRLALEALQYGANGLSIEIAPNESILEILKDIMTSYLEVRIDCSRLSSAQLDAQKALLSDQAFPNVRWTGLETGYDDWTIGQMHRIEDIRNLLNTIELSTAHTDIKVVLSKNMFYEIATLRAIRILLEESGEDNFNLIGIYEVEGTNELGDYDLIEKTYKVLSGILGGADAIMTSYAGDEASRLTLNILNILDLESGMRQVMDPVSGSYYIEKLTNEIKAKVQEA